MKLGLLLGFLGAYFFTHGIWRLYCLWLHRKAYSLFKQKGERFLDYLDRELDSWGTNIAVFLGLHWWYDCKLYPIIQILWGLLQVVFGIFIFILIFKVNSSDYKVFLGIEV